MYDSKSTVMCNNADIPGPSPNHKNALSLTSCKFCRAEVCTHPEKDYGCEEEMSLCGRFAHNRDKRDKKRKTKSSSLPQSHPDTEDRSQLFKDKRFTVPTTTVCV